MKLPAVFVGLTTAAGRTQIDPLGQVLKLMDDLADKVTHEGDVEAESFKKYFEWCDEVNRNGKFEVTTATGQKQKLEAQIADLTASIETGTSRIQELAASIAKLTTELTDASKIREKEVAEFNTAETELVEALDVLKRAISIISKEMEKNPALLQQTGADMQKMINMISSIIDAAGMSGTDQRHLAALIQSHESGGEEEWTIGAPESAVYKSHSGGIIDVLEDMREKAENELSDLRKAEVSSRHDFEKLKQSLTDELKVSNDEMSKQKQNLGENGEAKAAAEGDLEVTIKSLANARKEIDTAQKNCMRVAADHQATVVARAEELKVIAEAKKIIVEATTADAAFLQVNAMNMHERTKLTSYEIVNTIDTLAKTHHSSALSQLAARVKAVMRFSNDPFVKVRGLISDLISKLENQQDSEASEKAFCDEEMAKTSSQQEELDAVIAKLASKIDRATSRVAELRDEVREHEQSLAALAKEQMQMDKMRQESNANFISAKEELSKAISGIQRAMSILRDYYSGSSAFVQQPAAPELHKKAMGSGGGIIHLLEVCESDFSLALANEETEEASRAEAYEQNTQENKVYKAQTQQDIKYKNQEVTSLEKALSEDTSDRATAQTSVDAVNEYMNKLKGRCIQKPETYAERKQRREQEIDGLKEALRVLESETALVQKRSRRYSGLRGVGSISSSN